MTPDSFDPTALDTWLTAERVAGRLQGAVSLIQWRGRIVHARASGARNATGRPVTLDTRFWIASMTKPITSAAAMLLVERGLLRLTDPVGAYISGFGRRGVLIQGGASTRPLQREVSILDLMRHSAGVTYGQFGQDRIHRMYRACGTMPATIATWPKGWPACRCCTSRARFSNMACPPICWAG